MFDKKIQLVSSSLLLLFIMIGCSKSSSDSPIATTPVTGTVFAAAVSGGSVVVKDAKGNTIAGPVDTSSDGTYTVDVPTSALSDDFRVESTGGTYDDEATGTATTAGTLAAYVTGGSMTTGTVHLDPSSTIVSNLVTGSSKTYGEAQSLFSAAFGFMPDPSIACRNTPSTVGSDSERVKAFRAGVFSQLTKDLGLTPDMHRALIAALALDLADDGKLNGSAGTVNGTALPEDISSRFEQALMTFLTNTTGNHTGMTPDKIGSLPFARVVFTSTYRVEYVAGMMAASQGKTSFQIKITKRSDGSAATGLMLKLMPMMHMAAMQHGAPADAVTESSTPGTYDCTAYYLMASGPGMGYWELKVMIGSGMSGETAVFYPKVGMAMGADTLRATLYGPDDAVSSMTGTQYNKYYLMNDGLASGMTSTFKLFIAHSENMMMNFKPVSAGAVLSSPTGTAAVVSVSASTDSSFSTYKTGMDMGNGHWSMGGLSLNSGMTNTVYIRMTVNDQYKTTDGKTPSGTNSAAFGMSVGMMQ